MTAEFGLSLPELVAQPPFSIIDRWSHEDALVNSANFAGASTCSRNFSTQIGAKAATTAVSARSFASRSAVLPSVHPSCEKPIIEIATAPATAPQTAGVTLWYLLILFAASVCQQTLLLISPPQIRGPRKRIRLLSDG
jgi:hypothetical protein